MMESKFKDESVVILIVYTYNLYVLVATCTYRIANKRGADRPSRICAFVGRCGVADSISVNLIRKNKT